MAKSRSGGSGGGKGRPAGMGGAEGLGGRQGQMGAGLRGSSGLAFTSAATRAEPAPFTGPSRGGDFSGPVGGRLSGPGRPGGGSSRLRIGDPAPRTGITGVPGTETPVIGISDFSALAGSQRIDYFSQSRGSISQPSNPGIDLPFRVPAAEIEKVTEDKLMKPDVTASSTSDMKGIFILGTIAVITGLLVKAIRVPSV